VDRYLAQNMVLICHSNIRSGFHSGEGFGSLYGSMEQSVEMYSSCHCYPKKQLEDALPVTENTNL
jgi:hypothetical protein